MDVPMQHANIAGRSKQFGSDLSTATIERVDSGGFIRIRLLKQLTKPSLQCIQSSGNFRRLSVQFEQYVGDNFGRFVIVSAINRLIEAFAASVFEQLRFFVALVDVNRAMTIPEAERDRTRLLLIAVVGEELEDGGFSLKSDGVEVAGDGFCQWRGIA